MIYKSVQLTEEKTLEIYYEEPMEGGPSFTNKSCQFKKHNERE